ncbi:hypothetical protein GF318_02425 [Candidatus Micrarchaeota archaeon]|nr:hypothetical protein [Candidatus Micrarchaeota archaeon]
MKGKMMVFLFAALMTSVMAYVPPTEPYMENRALMAECLYDEGAEDEYEGDLYSEDINLSEDILDDVDELMDTMEDALEDMNGAMYGEGAPDYGAFNAAYLEFMTAYNQLQGMWFYYAIQYYLEEGWDISDIFDWYHSVIQRDISLCIGGETS